MERLIVWLAATGFVIHLMLIGLAQTVPRLRLGVLSQLDCNFLHAVYTPFSFILFYEVMLLVLALPRSHTSSMGKQYEIISLIVIRRVFKDIGEFSDPANLFAQTETAWMVLTDMLAALVMFAFCVHFVDALLRQAFVLMRCSFKQQTLSALNIAGARDGQGSQRGSCLAALSR